ncbi:SDR family oxidoreductase [Alteraurantiacibacter aquimixticola]|uniref:SDR family oxidoreductase n=1 Tax=Alteraurantiacibacter aquimixticola TaxID=2489173 RepID=A0A4T3EY66_9SPHN|nr:SDR family oxidoreductase [Alteraurantiacibacter aquimixticola]TIX49589.1 SDR family oxidoreductase [Alteraurantiacibacter aquimixticola]
MGKIIVTGASGNFGRAAAEQLLQKVAPQDVVCLTRSPEKLADLASKGAVVRQADFDDPESLVKAMEGGEKMLLISTLRVGTRVEQHRNAVEAAVANGVKHIVYTSVIGGGLEDHPGVEQTDHYDTEQIIKASGADYTFLRNSLYADAVATAMAIPALQAGSKPDNAGHGKVAMVAREDCVNIAVAVLTQDGHANKAYDVTGPELVSIPEAVAMISEMAGKPIDLQHVDDEGMYQYFDSLGVPRKASDVVPDGPIPWASEGMVTFGQSIREGYFDVQSDDVERITGKRPRSLKSVLEQYKGAWPA